LTASQIRRIVPRIKIHHLYTSTDSSIKIILQREGGLRALSHDVQGDVRKNASSSHYSVSAKQQTAKNTKTLYFGEGAVNHSLSLFFVRGRYLNINLAKRQGIVYLYL